jgi:hypothetical protein
METPCRVSKSVSNRTVALQKILSVDMKKEV